MIRVNGVRLELDDEPASRGGFARESGPLVEAVARQLGVSPGQICAAEVVRRNVDARKKSDVHFVVNAVVALSEKNGADFCKCIEMHKKTEQSAGYCDEYSAFLKPSNQNAIYSIQNESPKSAFWGICRKNGLHFTNGPEKSSIGLPLGLVNAFEADLIAAGKALPYEPLAPIELPAIDVAAPDYVRPVVVGAGPAGLFAGLYLALAGARPIVIERGASVERRAQAVERFFAGGELDPQTNIQFGEGGAGTFSDGKLNTGTKHPFTQHVMRLFAAAGAPEDILWDAHPHIGSDLLPDVVHTLREAIRAAGGTVVFDAQVTELHLRDGRLDYVVVAPGSAQAGADIALLATGGDPASVLSAGVPLAIPCRHLVLACGHSARDTFEALLGAGLHLERKPFAVGVRIEHAQAAVNRAQWGAAADHPALAGMAAPYKLAVHVDDARSAFTFCMCPGGTVVAASSEPGGVVTNGMSLRARDGANANAALLVNVEPDDFGPETEGPLAGIELQRRIERRAYEAAIAAGGVPFSAPAQTVGSFLAGEGRGSGVGECCPISSDAADRNESTTSVPSDSSVPVPTYPRGVAACDLRDVLPGFVCDTIAKALPLLERRLAGFSAPEALMTAPETRSSSPVRINRGVDLQAFCEPAFAAVEGDEGGYKRAAGGTGVYPCGEGGGYAGGIVSAAADGLRVAEAVARELARTFPVVSAGEGAQGGTLLLGAEPADDALAPASAASAVVSAPEQGAPDLAAAIDALRAGEAVVLPTDTVYGVGVAVRAAQPQTLFRLKERDADKPIAWLVAGPEALDELGRDISPAARAAVGAHWPGPLTVVVRAGDAVPAAWASPQGTIGLRMPANETALALIRAAGPLAVSSANLSGAPTPTHFEDIVPELLARAAAVVRDDAPKSGAPSTVLDCTQDPPRILREGAITAAMLGR